jgi:hypothetical protein
MKNAVTSKPGNSLTALAVAALAWSGGLATAETANLAAAADTYLRDNTDRGTVPFMDVRGGGVDFRGYLRFDLSSVPIDTITAATLTLYQVDGASRNDTITTGRFALYGLNDVVGNTPQNWIETGAGYLNTDNIGLESVTALTGVTDLDDDVAGITETVVGAAPDGVVTVSGDALAAFLQTRSSSGGMVTFILSNDDAIDRGFGIGTKEARSLQPARPVLSLTYTTVPLLTIFRPSSNTVVVSWPSPSTGWYLQQNGDLSTTNWIAPVESITDNGTIKFVIINPPMGHRFYRLLKP